MSPAIRAALAAWSRRVGATPIFLNQATGQADTPAAVSTSFQRACRQASVTGATLHDLRHTFVRDEAAIRCESKVLNH
jgi:integrase